MNSSSPDGERFPIVGLGASAGGLDALQHFFGAVPADSGMAYVVVMHLAPDHESNVAHLLGVNASIPVHEVTDTTPVQSDHGYIVAPDTVMRLDGRTLRVADRDHTRRALVIDDFFESLSVACGARAAAIVLSGTGTDGSSGIKKVKAADGIVFAQSPKSAAYAGMPQSAIATGVVTLAADPEELPAKLVAHFRNERTLDERIEEEEYALSQIFAILRHRLGHDFAGHKESTLYRRLQRRMVLNGTETREKYVEFLRQNLPEAQALFREFLIGVTHFFREPESFEALVAQVVPTLLDSVSDGETLRVWVAGCSTGEEAYSLAITLREAIDARSMAVKLQIFATDLDEAAIETARAGVYPESVAADITDARLQRYFVHEGRHYRVRKGIRESVVFSVQDLLADPPFSRLHIVFCRNVLIYLKPHAQARLLPLFHYTLNPGGVLVLGSSESIGSFTTLFSVVDRDHKIFGKLDLAAPQRGQLQFPTGLAGFERRLPGPRDAAEEKPGSESTALLTQQLILDRYAPTAILVEPDGAIVHIQGKTGKYLEAVTGPPTSNLVDLARPGLRLELAHAIRTARTSDAPVTRRDVVVHHHDIQESVDISAMRIDKPDRLAGRILIVFRSHEPGPGGDPTGGGTERSEGPRDDAHAAQIIELEMELQKNRESHQSTVEELESANEELKSINEELQSANEELQSTAEENESSKEELHSLNEELQATNAQLEDKIQELQAVNDDIRNLLDSTDVASLFVDASMRLRRFTPRATDLVHVIESDVGRPLAHLVRRFAHDTLIDDVRDATTALKATTTEIVTEDGLWYRMRVVPYLTAEQDGDGAVITFIPIVEQKIAEDQLAITREEAEAAWAGIRSAIDRIGRPIAMLDRTLTMCAANDEFCTAVGAARDELIGSKIADLAADEGWPTVQTALLGAFDAPAAIEAGEVRLGTTARLALSAHACSRGPEPVVHILIEARQAKHE